MPQKSQSAEKENLHPRNLHRGRYDFKQLCKTSPGLKAFVSINQYQDESIDFSNREAVRALNKALLKHFYNVDNWDIPPGYLCPPIPGRADYIHYIADLLNETQTGVAGNKIKVLDIGVGASCIYPLIGNSIYGWQFVGTDIDPDAIRSAKKIISTNKSFQDNIELRLQTGQNDIFKEVIKPGEVFDISICNPPFHASSQDAQAGTVKKWENLKGRSLSTQLNFGGKNTELWCAGGEAAFINRIIEQSVLVANQCKWFSSLVSKKDTLPIIYKTLKWVNAADVRTINMAQGQKISRVVAWRF
ncbi:23S rRNA (adenine(1618)-N(6))-methyltransferase RlmF [Mucilaginibacter sp.]|uniref:23S rRNA (adenine(1618)-N(6))-methyltransferase RlmF n=1 Tax=Mucilaginibacter sp. TaxID=1882438 RepID=UPI0026256708|nr:23S rRNA (adenine(1618)-N(6))-methyltransferase RlmF [Mucilaginibacter sp.]MDB4927515.1 rRNA ((1618)-N(6))-methyltransferase [Mucilaginibacter sp.]